MNLFFQTSEEKNRIEENYLKQLSRKKKKNRISGLSELLVSKLNSLYLVELQLIRTLPRVIKYTRSVELANSLEIHLIVSKEQVRRLEAVFESITEYPPEKLNSVTAAVLLKQVNESLEATAETMVRDSAIILAVQQIIHHNIVLFGSLGAFAKVLGAHDAASLLADSLEEEKNSDRDLTQIAETFINPIAAHGYAVDNTIKLESKLLFN